MLCDAKRKKQTVEKTIDHMIPPVQTVLLARVCCTTLEWGTAKGERSSRLCTRLLPCQVLFFPVSVSSRVGHEQRGREREHGDKHSSG